MTSLSIRSTHHATSLADLASTFMPWDPCSLAGKIACKYGVEDYMPVFQEGIITESLVFLQETKETIDGGLSATERYLTDFLKKWTKNILVADAFPHNKTKLGKSASTPKKSAIHSARRWVIALIKELKPLQVFITKMVATLIGPIELAGVKVHVIPHPAHTSGDRKGFEAALLTKLCEQGLVTRSYRQLKKYLSTSLYATNGDWFDHFREYLETSLSPNYEVIGWIALRDAMGEHLPKSKAVISSKLSRFKKWYLNQYRGPKLLSITTVRLTYITRIGTAASA